MVEPEPLPQPVIKENKLTYYANLAAYGDKTYAETYVYDLSKMINTLNL